ncbi:hypothetical protein [Streptomyces sp. MAI_2237]
MRAPERAARVAVRQTVGLGTRPVARDPGITAPTSAFGRPYR